MSLVDNIHQGKVSFTADEFVILKIDFQGTIFQGNTLMGKGDVELTYDVTGRICLILKTDLNIESTDKGKFILYKIIGNDNDYDYEINDCFFTARAQINPHTPLFYYQYKGTVKEEILITKKNYNPIDIIVCDCICDKVPMYSDSIKIDWRDINISQNRNQWNNEGILHIFKNLLGTTMQYMVPDISLLNVKTEINIYNKLEYALSFILGHDFGISICKYINTVNNSIEIYIIRNKKNNNTGNHALFGDDIAKIKNLFENCKLLDKINADYYKETINSLSKFHSEPDIIIDWSILIITFERFLNNILIEKCFTEQNLKGKNLLVKLNMYNKCIGKKIPKIFLTEKLIKDYRNPLIHAGKLNEKDIDIIIQFMFKYQDLLYSLILDSMDYNDDFILSSNNFRWGKII